MQGPVESPGPSDTESINATYVRALGSRLRALRHQMGLTLQDVKRMSDGKMGTTVLGSYERGDRVITAPRLQWLARIYDLPVDQLLPPEGDAQSVPADARDAGLDPVPSRRSGLANPRKVAIDLARLKEQVGPEWEILRRFVDAIRLERQDFNGRMITIRTGDLRVLASTIGFTPDAMGRRLDDLGLLVGP